MVGESVGRLPRYLEMGLFGIPTARIKVYVIVAVGDILNVVPQELI